MVHMPSKVKENTKAARESSKDERVVVERVQTGVRMEKRLLKVLKAMAEYYEMSLGDLLEGIVLHAFDGKCPFREESLKLAADLKRIYKLDLDSSHSHHLIEIEQPVALLEKGGSLKSRRKR
jgi:predicted DNA-binding ribbon-helix-helix protein